MICAMFIRLAFKPPHKHTHDIHICRRLIAYFDIGLIIDRCYNATHTDTHIKYLQTHVKMEFRENHLFKMRNK